MLERVDGHERVSGPPGISEWLCDCGQWVSTLYATHVHYRLGIDRHVACHRGPSHLTRRREQ